MRNSNVFKEKEREREESEKGGNESAGVKMNAHAIYSNEC